MGSSVLPRTPVSIVCVFNDPDVLESCLATSVRAGLADAPQTELIPVDNRAGEFRSAGAALNYGARAAHHSVVVFVHQDVVLHSLRRLEEAAQLLVDEPDLGIIGAAGIDHEGRVVGRVRDRVVEIGESAPLPRDVDSLDEVLFMIGADQVRQNPLSEDPLLAWHAYAVEYSARMRRMSRRATAMDLSITHNSLTVNLDRLDVAHRKVGSDYPELLPLRTTCGTIYRGDGPGGLARAARRRHGAAIWWGESWESLAIARTAHRPVVLADIRLLVDEAVQRGRLARLRVLDLASPSTTSVHGLSRFGRSYAIDAVRAKEVPAILGGRAADEAVLLTGLRRDELGVLGIPSDAPCTVGLWRDTGLWVLIGVRSELVETLWSDRRSKPFAGVLPGRNTRADIG